MMKPSPLHYETARSKWRERASGHLSELGRSQRDVSTANVVFGFSSERTRMTQIRG